MTTSNNTQLTYKDSGVDIDAGNEIVEKIKTYCKATRRPGSDCVIGGFGGLFDLNASGFGGEDTILVAATDGVGTKLKVVELSNIHDHIGIDLVAMCVNDIIVQGAEPLFFLDYLATGRLNVDHTSKIVESISKGCVMAGCALIGGETAEMPSMYAPGAYDLGGFAVGAVKKNMLLGQKGSLDAGDTILGIPSSGIHSNGFSLVRKVVERAKLKYSDPAPFLTENVEGISLGEALLTPTRIYVKLLMPLIKAGLLKGLVHITGGGIPDNLPRLLSEEQSAHICFENSGWKLPALFKWLLEETKLDDFEFMRTFNCGIGMLLIVSPSECDSVISKLQEQGEEVFNLGTIKSRSHGDSPITFSGNLC